MKKNEGYCLTEEATEILSQFKDFLRCKYGVEIDDALLVSYGTCLKIYTILNYLHSNREKDILMFHADGSVVFHKPDAVHQASIEALMNRTHNYIYGE